MGMEGLYEHINTQHNAQFPVDDRADQNEYGQIECDHQNGPADGIGEKIVGYGCQTADAARCETVAVLEEMVCGSDYYACKNSVEYIGYVFFEFCFHTASVVIYSRISFRVKRTTVSTCVSYSKLKRIILFGTF